MAGAHLPSLAEESKPEPAKSLDSSDTHQSTITSEEKAQTAGAFAETSNYFEERFSPLDPVYIVFGWRDEFHSKFQLSFKYRIIREGGWAASKFGVLDDLYFGYTQFSLWDMGEKSSPFRDTNYKPGMFYEANFGEGRLDWMESFGLRTGYEHESNGRDGTNSRSLNILYLRPRLVLGDSRKYYFEIAPKAYVYVGNLDENPDIAEYRGYVDLTLRTGYGNGWQISSTFRRGTQDHYGSIQVDATYPLSRILFLKDLGGFLQLQYFNGWGESLIDYNEKRPSQFRVGIMILR